MTPLPEASALRKALLLGAAFGLASAIVLAAIYVTISNSIDRAIEQRVLTQLQSFSAVHASRGLTGLGTEIAKFGEQRLGAGDVVLLVDRDLRRVAGNIPRWPERLASTDGVKAYHGPDASDHTGLAFGHLIIGVRALGAEHHLLYGYDSLARERFAATYRGAAIATVLLMALLAGATVFALTQRLDERIAHAAAACDSIVAGDLSRRLPARGGGDAVDHISRSVNRMLDRIEELTRTRRTVFDSAAHDLRGPLYRLRNRIEASIRRARAGAPVPGLEDALQDIDGIQRTLVLLLQIARAESGAPLVDVTRFDLAALVRDIVELYEPEARRESLQLLHRARVPVSMAGNRQLVAQLITNLIENGIKYVPAGGEIIASVERTSAGVQLVVADNGRGIAAADRARALQPFVRLDSAFGGQGSGLGLSLVAAIARLHGAELRLEDNAPGLRVVVQFAATAAGAADSPPPVRVAAADTAH